MDETIPKHAADEPVLDDRRAVPDRVVALIRTLTPIIVGAILAALTAGLRLTGYSEALPSELEPYLNQFFFVLLSGGYYSLALWLEKKFPRIPWLGVRKTPTYS